MAAAVGIALWTERRSEKRVREERKRSDRQIAEERELSDQRVKAEHERGDRLLAEQRALDKAAVEDERAHARSQLEEERRLAFGREQRHLYTALLLNLDALARAIKTPLAADPELRAGTVSDAIGIAVGNVHRSYYAVYLTGSPDVLPIAETAWQAAWHIHDWAATGHPNRAQALVELEVLRRRLNEAAESFADVVRKETAGQ